MKKKLLLSVLYILSVFIVTLVVAKAGGFHHNPNQVHFTLNGKQVDLEDAIDDKTFNKDYSIEETSDEFYTGHTLDEIYVNVNNEVKTFAKAMSDGSLRNTRADKSPTDYSSKNIIFGEMASNVLITGEKDLQTMINDGYFYTGCGNHLDGSKWTEDKRYSYECSCDKNGCDTCYGTKKITKTCKFRKVIG